MVTRIGVVRPSAYAGTLLLFAVAILIHGMHLWNPTKPAPAVGSAESYIFSYYIFPYYHMPYSCWCEMSWISMQDWGR